MPEFPKYPGKLPKCIHPLNPRHWLLLAYWVFFRPTALKSYLYQADPELYCNSPEEGRRKVFRTLNVTTYRNLLLTIPGATILSLALIGLPVVWLTSWVQEIPIEWLAMVWGMVWGMACGLGFVFSDIVFGITFAVSWGLAGGISGGMSGGIELSVVTGGIFSLWVITWIYQVAIRERIGRLLSLVVLGGVVAGSVLGGLAIGIANSVKVSIVSSMMASTMFGLAFGVAFGVMGISWEIGVSILFGIIFGLAASILSFTAIGTVALGGIVGVMFGAGSLRLPIYPFQWGFSFCNFLGVRHPLLWDELIVLPLPNTQRFLLQQLCQEEHTGLLVLARIAGNPCQRWGVQKALKKYLEQQPYFLQKLYYLLQNYELDIYTYAPTIAFKDSSLKRSWMQPSAIRLFLGELGGYFVYTKQVVGVERFVWKCTLFLRDRQPTPLTRFAGMLYKLLRDETVNAEDFNLAKYHPIYTCLNDYPGGIEIERTFNTFDIFLNYTNYAQLVEVSTVVADLPPIETAIRPNVITALHRFANIGNKILVYETASSRVNQLTALARAEGSLNDLEAYIAAEVVAPERTILQRILQQWRRLVSEALGEAGSRQEDCPVENPYVAGNPVTGSLFVGREDLLKDLEELWMKTGQCESVVLYGHRRMGKSSILKNLHGRFGNRTHVVDFNMQRVGLIRDTAELLYSLALAIYDSLPPDRQAALGEPEETPFRDRNPYTAFDRFLRQLARVRGEERFIVAIDEFELIEKYINEGRLNAELLSFWRGIIQTYPWVVMVFAGLYTLQEKCHDYWHPLFASVKARRVSFLSPKAAVRLIVQPTLDFDINYDRDAVDRIYGLTHGQPYLIQLICQNLVTRYNRQRFEEGRKLERRFRREDVEAIVNASSFYRDGNAYFEGVWRQAEDPSGQQAALRALCNGALSLAALRDRTALPPEALHRALEILCERDAIAVREDGKYAFTVELMRRWVERNS